MYIISFNLEKSFIIYEILTLSPSWSYVNILRQLYQVLLHEIKIILNFFFFFTFKNKSWTLFLLLHTAETLFRIPYKHSGPLTGLQLAWGPGQHPWLPFGCAGFAALFSGTAKSTSGRIKKKSWINLFWFLRWIKENIYFFPNSYLWNAYYFVHGNSLTPPSYTFSEIWSFHRHGLKKKSICIRYFR